MVNRATLLQLHGEFVGHDPETENTLENETLITNLIADLCNRMQKEEMHSHSITVTKDEW